MITPLLNNIPVILEACRWPYGAIVTVQSDILGKFPVIMDCKKIRKHDNVAKSRVQDRGWEQD